MRKYMANRFKKFHIDKSPFFMNSIYRVAFVAAVLGLSISAFSESLTLEQVIREVCTKSDSAKMMRESIIKSDATVTENWSAVWPKISFSGNVNHSSPINPEKASPVSFSPPADSLEGALLRDGFLTGDLINSMFSGLKIPQPSTTYNGSLSASVPLYTFGKVGTAIKVAKTFNKSTHSSHSRNLQTLQLTALDLFYRTQLAIESAKIAERTLGRKKDLEEFIVRNFQLGSGVKAQMLVAKADAFNQSAITITAKRDAESARMFLNTFLGRNLTDDWSIDTSSIPGALQKIVPTMTDTMIASVIEQRKDVQSLKLMAESTRGGADIYRKMWMPSIYGNGSVGYTRIDSKSLMAQNGAFNAAIGASLSCQLFDGFQNSSKAAEFLSDARKLEIVEGTVKKAAEIEIRSAFIECGAADSTLVAMQEMYKAANEAYDLTNSNFKQGSGMLTDLQRVDEQLQQAEFAMLNARYRQVRSRAALLVAIGEDIVEIK
jgi:outer membrane protein